MDQAVRLLAERVGVEAIDTLWLFPPRARGRTEQGLVVAGCFEAGEPRRRVVTAVYRAEQTAKGIQVDTQFFEEGIAAPERLSGIIDGVVERGEEQPGEPRRVEIGGASERLNALLAELAR
ncbi:MAG: hypothetical protein HY701_11875 [Gemmatimonadetes bacterium]|nr:hypothetical protein [Gemmatimonadota bacterium]